ncbi:ABC transporter ATP-binding protein [Tessaracoccus sp. MC1756]|uniref:ABC transporter ATP-binding protein n=1 Tax=Tessaracoccus sp. MC1756 TaxID=2760311 RepID=UPI001600B750|nr:ABC transporter ATP-binding protein [Tessaracoccus sp. MC1756]MBB1509431.1 ABC transporter ATP-binding protein [Tessaracoccus sp. MC1756]
MTSRDLTSAPDAEFALRGVTKKYPGFALGPLDLVVPRGFVMGLVGANGAGKTTAIKVGLGMVHPDEGRAQDVDRTRLGVVMDSAPYPALWKVRDVHRALAPFYPRWDQARFDELLGWAGIDEKKCIKELSRGMSMRLQLAVALSHGAELLVLDEPTSGLDPLARRELVDMLAEFMTDERHSVLFSTHITTDLDRVADYITLLHNGRVLTSGTRDELVESFRTVRGARSHLDDVRGLVRGLRLHDAGWEGLMATEHTVALNGSAAVEEPSLDDIIVAFAKEN